MCDVIALSRAGGNIAASWATLKHLGQNGYMKIAEELMDTTNKLKEGISKIPVTMLLLPVLRVRVTTQEIR